ncbi:YceI family protein [Isoptericola sp. b515]|uniref:YceI family protein n=1 Tax=Isoptericola sp. b515 TaxID=3064652 RepID=UPI00271282E8|nr:YceI family protein [Isoptericola sp. b515]MDO8147870.1 YceI family protein [Isoptericola sp. b515]
MRAGATAAIVAGAVVVVGATAVIAGPGLYADWANRSAADAPSVTGTATEVDPADLDGEWTVATGSFAGYRVHEVLRGEDVTVTGRTDPASSDVAGTVTVADGSVTAAEVVVRVEAIATDQAPRDAYFRASVMDVDTFPTATFELTTPVVLDPGGRDVELTGDLTLRDVTREVTVPAQVAASADGAQVAGSVPVTFTDFGIEAPSLGFVEVDEEGAVEFSLELVPAG